MVVIFGEALVDRVPGERGLVARPGGSPANVAVGLARLGQPSRLLARLSTDHFGHILRRHLTASGVDLSLAVTTHQPTTVATVDIGADAAASYTFELDGRADDGWVPDDLPTTLPAGEPLHVSGAFALVRPAMRSTVDALLTRERGQRPISIDPNPRPQLSLDRAGLRVTLERWLARADVVKVSTEDLAWTYPGGSVPDLARGFLGLGPALVVVTRGADGVYAVSRTEELERPGRAVTVVDTVGAGDAFMAGLLTALGPGLDGVLADALDFAQHVAAITCTRAGADPPWWDDLA